MQFHCRRVDFSFYTVIVLELISILNFNGEQRYSLLAYRGVHSAQSVQSYLKFQSTIKNGQLFYLISRQNIPWRCKTRNVFQRLGVSLDLYSHLQQPTEIKSIGLTVLFCSEQMDGHVASKNSEMSGRVVHPCASCQYGVLFSNTDDPYVARFLYVTTAQLFNHSYLPCTWQHSAQVFSSLSYAKQYRYLTNLIFSGSRVGDDCSDVQAACIRVSFSGKEDCDPAVTQEYLFHHLPVCAQCSSHRSITSAAS